METKEALFEHQEPLSVTKHWHRMPREAVVSPFLEMLQGLLNRILENRL